MRRNRFIAKKFVAKQPVRNVCDNNLLKPDMASILKELRNVQHKCCYIHLPKEHMVTTPLTVPTKNDKNTPLNPPRDTQKKDDGIEQYIYKILVATKEQKQQLCQAISNNDNENVDKILREIFNNNKK